MFRDVDRLRPGNWRKQIDQFVADCAAVIVVIGPQWLAALEQRLAGDDQVRYEIEQALLLGKTIIPVTVGRAQLPDRSKLPGDIAAVIDAEAYELIPGARGGQPLGKLLDALSDLLQDRSTAQHLSQTPAESRPENVVTVAEVKSARHEAEQRVPAPPSIFISYMRQDAEAARRLANAIIGLGGQALLDERRVSPGDKGEKQKEILTAIGETVRLFIPVISVNTERQREGRVFREWREAIERSRMNFEWPLHSARGYRRGLRRRHESLPADSRFFQGPPVWSRAWRRPGRGADRHVGRRNPCSAAPRHTVTGARCSWTARTRGRGWSRLRKTRVRSSSGATMRQHRCCITCSTSRSRSCTDGPASARRRCCKRAYSRCCATIIFCRSTCASRFSRVRRH